MKITVDGLTEHIHDTTRDVDAWIEVDPEVGRYLRLLRNNLDLRIYFNTFPEDVFDSADIAMVNLTDNSTGRDLDLEPEVFHVADVYDFTVMVTGILAMKL